MFWAGKLELGKCLEIRSLRDCGEILKVTRVVLESNLREGITYCGVRVVAKFEDMNCVMARIRPGELGTEVDLFFGTQQDVKIYFELEVEEQGSEEIKSFYVVLIGYFEPVDKIVDDSFSNDENLSSSEELIIPPKNKINVKSSNND